MFLTSAFPWWTGFGDTRAILSAGIVTLPPLLGYCGYRLRQTADANLRLVAFIPLTLSVLIMLFVIAALLCE